MYSKRIVFSITCKTSTIISSKIHHRTWSCRSDITVVNRSTKNSGAKGSTIRTSSLIGRNRNSQVFNRTVFHKTKYTGGATFHIHILQLMSTTIIYTGKGGTVIFFADSVIITPARHRGDGNIIRLFEIGISGACGNLEMLVPERSRCVNSVTEIQQIRIVVNGKRILFRTNVRTSVRIEGQTTGLRIGSMLALQLSPTLLVHLHLIVQWGVFHLGILFH